VKKSATAYRWMLAIVLAALLIPAVGAAPVFAHDGDPGGHAPNPPTTSAGDYDDPLLEPVATASLPDVFAEAMTAPCEGDQGGCTSGRLCNTAVRDDRTNGPVPSGGTSQIINIYFVPTDVPTRTWDRPVLCNDGSSTDGLIGRAAWNNRVWMSNVNGTQGDRIRGQAFRMLKKNYSDWGRTWNLDNILFVRAQNNDSFYYSNTFEKIRIELDNRNWQQSYAKYHTYADVCASGTNGGFAQYGGHHASSFRRWGTCGSTTTQPWANRWGCADEGDTVGIQEILHNWQTVNPASPDHDGGHPFHATQTNDAMHWRIESTYSGRRSNGTAIQVTAWDPGADSYTTRVLSYPAYLLTIGTGRPFYLCA
jgi:hypothetical protein